jgi:excisionase family DNA binding protein
MTARARLELEEMLAVLESDAELARRARRVFGSDTRPTESDAPEFVDAKGARSMGLEPTKLRRLSAAGELPTYKPGKKFLWRRDDLLELVERHRVVAPAEPLAVDGEDSFERALRRAGGRR